MGKMFILEDNSTSTQQKEWQCHDWKVLQPSNPLDQGALWPHAQALGLREWFIFPDVWIVGLACTNTPVQ